MWFYPPPPPPPPPQKKFCPLLGDFKLLTHPLFPLCNGSCPFRKVEFCQLFDIFKKKKHLGSFDGNYNPLRIFRIFRIFLSKNKNFVKEKRGKKRKKEKMLKVREDSSFWTWNLKLGLFL
jgi:hypothetical protein